MFRRDHLIHSSRMLSCPVASGDEETPMPGARRTIKFPLTEIPINCPHCKTRLILATVMDVIKFGQRRCPKCGKRFVIENNVPRMMDDSLKKPNASVKPAKNVRKSKSR
jgi:uncharacterized protein YbaR (Trm112 family)